MLSFERGQPIAKIIDKESGKEMNTVFINNEITDASDFKNFSAKFLIDPLASFDKDFFRKTQRRKNYISNEEKKQLRNALRRDEEPDDPRLTGFYYQAKNHLHNKLNRELFLDNEKLKIVPIPDVNITKSGSRLRAEPKRECIYIGAPSGAGKSTYVADYAKEYHKLFPKNKIYMFSRVSKDPSIDKKIKVKRILINDNIIDDPIEPSELKNSLVIFDDIDTLKEKNLKDAVIDLRKDLLETGRHEDVYVASTNHQLTNYSKTRDLLSESRAVTFFPQSGDTHHIEHFLRTYANIKKTEDVNKYIGLPSRWVTIYKSYPMYILHEQGVILLNNGHINKTVLKSDPNVFNYNDATSNKKKMIHKLKYDDESESSEEEEPEDEIEEYDEYKSMY
jgi:hypothetical protein